MNPKHEHASAHVERLHRAPFVVALSLILALLLALGPAIRPANAEGDDSPSTPTTDPSPTPTPTPDPGQVVVISNDIIVDGTITITIDPATPPPVAGTIGGCPVYAIDLGETTAYGQVDSSCVLTDAIFVPIGDIGGGGTIPPSCAPTPTRIVQDCDLVMPDTRTVLQVPAINNLLKLHVLPPADAARLLDWERSMVRAAMFERLLAVIDKAPEAGTAERAVVDAFAARLQRQRLTAATFARSEYNRWASNPCRYYPPAPFTYNRPTCSQLGNLFGTGTPPSFEEFQSYGVNEVYKTFSNDATLQRVSGETARNFGVLAGFVAAGIAGRVGATIGGSLAAGGAIMAALHPFLVASLATAGGVTKATVISTGVAAGVTGATSIAAAAAVVVLAVVIGVVQGIAVFSAAEIPGKLNAAVTAAQATPDLKQVISTDAGKQELFALFVAATMPDFAPTGSVPEISIGDPQFLVTAPTGSPSVSAEILYDDWKGNDRRARMSGGWFVNDLGGAPELTLSIDYIDWLGNGWTAARVGDTFLHTRTGGAAGVEPFVSDEIKYQTPDGLNYTARVVYPNIAPSFTKGANVTVNEDAGTYGAAWATAMSTGPARESTQTITFLVSNDNNALFSAQPTINSEGTLSFTPAANANGSVTVSVAAQDSGGTANGGDDISDAQTFTITVNAVNDAPSVPATAPTISLVEDTASSFSLVTDLGVNDTADTSGPVAAGAASFPPVTSLATVTAPAKGALDYTTTGTLGFTPTANANGADSFRYRVCDQGTPGSACAEQTVNMSITPVNDPPSFSKGADQIAVLNASQQMVSGWATAIAAGPANESGQALSFTVTNDNGALFSQQPALAPNGTLSYTPAAGKVGSAVVTVVLQDDGGTANGGSDTSITQTFRITVRYNFGNFAHPVDLPPAINIATAGRTIPIKWRLTDASGAPVTNLSSVTLTAPVQSNSTDGTSDAIEVYVDGSAGLRNLGDGYYQYNWPVPKSYAGSVRMLLLDLGEGPAVQHPALFQFK